MNISVFHELPVGGARRAVNEIAYQLKKNNTIDLYIIDEKEKSEERKFFSNVYFYQFIPKRWSGKDWKTRVYKDTFELLKIYLLHKKIAKSINSSKYDVVFVHPSKFTQAPLILRFLKSYIVYYCQEPLRMVYDEIFKPRQKNSVRGWYEIVSRRIRASIDNQSIRRADKILVNSKFTKKNVYSAYQLDSEVCYLGVDTNFFKSSSLRKDIDVLFIGTDDRIDGYSLFKKILKYTDSKYKIKIINSRNWVPEKELLKSYQTAKIVLCLAHKEPFGLIPLEAAACDCVVVAVGEGGYKESIINRKTGLLVSRHAKQIAKKLNYLLSHPDTIYKMSKNARINVVMNWTWEKSAASFLEAIKKCTKR